MIIDIVVPDLGDFEDVEVIELLVAAGNVVDKEDGLITLETDKAAMDVPAPDSGVIEELKLTDRPPFKDQRHRVLLALDGHAAAVDRDGSQRHCLG